MGAQERAILKGFFKDLLAMHESDDVVEALAEASVEREAECKPARAGGADAERAGYAKFLTISDRLRLMRFRGPDFAKLIGRTAAHDGIPPQCYEIHVDKTAKSDDGHTAYVYRNGKELFYVHGKLSSSLVENMALSAFKRWWKQTRAANRRSRNSRKKAKTDLPKEG